MKHDVTPANAEGARVCDECGNRSLQYSWQKQKFLYGADSEQVTLEAIVPVWSCAVCGEAFADGKAEELRHDAVCRHLRRLTPNEICQVRNANGLSQDAFAELTGLGVASIKRWERGRQIQTASADRFLRLLSDSEVFAKLRSLLATPASPKVAPAPRFRTALSPQVYHDATVFRLTVVPEGRIT